MFVGLKDYMVFVISLANSLANILNIKIFRVKDPELSQTAELIQPTPPDEENDIKAEEPSRKEV